MTATDRKGFDPLLLVMVVGFVMAVGALAYPAFRADPMSAPGLVLIFTAGAVARKGSWAGRFYPAEISKKAMAESAESTSARLGRCGGDAVVKDRRLPGRQDERHYAPAVS